VFDDALVMQVPPVQGGHATRTSGKINNIDYKLVKTIHMT
jgi:hypothetical protein